MKFETLIFRNSDITSLQEQINVWLNSAQRAYEQFEIISVNTDIDTNNEHVVYYTFKYKIEF